MATYVQYVCYDQVTLHGINGYRYSEATGCGHVFNVEYTANPKRDGHPVDRQLVTCHYPRHEWNGQIMGLVQVLCPRCNGYSKPTKRIISGTINKTACEAVCETAEGKDCKCSCGGSNHGIKS